MFSFLDDPLSNNKNVTAKIATTLILVMTTFLITVLYWVVTELNLRILFILFYILFYIQSYTLSYASWRYGSLSSLEVQCRDIPYTYFANP